MKKLLLGIIVLVFLVGMTPAWTVAGETRAQGTVEITFSHIFPDERDVRRSTIEEIAAAYMEQNPGVVVNIQTTTDKYAEVFEAAMRGIEQGNAPHVIQVEESLVQIAIDSQLFVKLSDYATDEQKASIPDIIEPMRNFYDITEDDFWVLPWNASNPIMYYNPDMFEAAGLDPNTPPQTFEQLTAACDAIMAAGIEGLDGCINWPVTSWLLEQWVSMQGALYVNNDNGRSARATEALIDSPEMLSAVTWWKDLADKGYYTYSGSTEAYTPDGLLFVTKKIAIHLSTSAGLSNIMSFSTALGKFTPLVAPFPRPTEDATNGITPGGAAIAVTSGHSEEEIQAAVDFAFFLINTDNMSTWHKASGYFPVLQSSIDQLTAEGWFDENPYFRLPLDQLLAAEPNASNAGMRIGASSQVRGAVIDAVLSVIDGGEDPAEALAAAKERADKALADYNSVVGD